MSRAEEQIRRFEARRPLAVRLAEAVSLAVIADPPLLRKARLELVPDADPGTEADLWLSPLVQTRSPDGIVFAPEIADALRARLAGDSGRFEKAWDITSAMHGHLTPALRREEEIAWLFLAPASDTRATDRIEEILRSALAALVVGERRGLAHWAARALPKLPSGVRQTKAARMLEAGAHLRLRGDARSLREEEKASDWLSWVAPADLPRVPIAVRLFEGAVELDARPNTEGRQIQIPQTDPLLVELSWDEPGGESKAVQITFRKGEMQRIPVPVQYVCLQTMLGEVYSLRKAGTAPRGLTDWIIDFSEERARHRPFFGREEELERIQHELNTEGPGKLILVTGEVGTGKTALLAQVIDRLTEKGLEPAHHFFRRGRAYWANIAAAERSLIAQIARRFPEISLAARHLPLSEVLEELLRRRLLGPKTEPLVLVLDAMDEAEPNDPAIEALLELLPAKLPEHVVTLFSTQSPPLEHARVLAVRSQMLLVSAGKAEGIRSGNRFAVYQSSKRIAEAETRKVGDSESWIEIVGKAETPVKEGDYVMLLGQVLLTKPFLQLDASDSSLRQFWEHHSRRLDWPSGALSVVSQTSLPRTFGAAQVLLAGLEVWGEFRSGLDGADRKGLEWIWEELRVRVGTDAVAIWLGSLAASFEALPASFLVGATKGKDFGDALSPFVSGHHAQTEPVYELREEILRGFISSRLDLTEHHLRLAHASTEAISDEAVTNQARLYGLRHAADHWLAAGETETALRHLTRADALTARCRELGVSTAIRVLRRGLDASVSLLQSSAAPFESFSVEQPRALLQALIQTAPHIKRRPEDLPSILYSQFRGQGWDPKAIREFLQLPPGVPTLRLAEPFSSERRRPPVRHRGQVTGCRFVDVAGPAVLSWSTDATLRLWDTTSGELRATLTGHHGPVTACAVLNDGRAISSSHTLRLWDLRTGSLIKTMRGHQGHVLGVLALDESRVVSWSADRTIRIWNLESGQEVLVLRGHEGAVTACAVTLSRRTVISGSEDTTVRFWDVSSGDLFRTDRGHTGPVTGIAIRDETDYLFSTSQDRTIRIHGIEEPDDENRPAVLEGHQLGVLGCAISPDGSLLATWSYDRTIRLWQLSSYEHDQWAQSPAGPLIRPLAILTGHEGAVLSCTFSPEGDRLVSCSADRTVRVWDMETRIAVAVFEEHEAPVHAVAVSERSARIVSVSDDRTVRVNQQELGKSEALAVLVSTVQNRVLVGSSSGSLAIYDSQSGRNTYQKGVVGSILGGVLAPGKSFAVIWVQSQSAETGHDIPFYRVNLFAGLEEINPIGVADHVTACAVTPDGSELVVASDRNLRTWNLWMNRPTLALESHAQRISDVKLLPDGRALSASWDGTLRLWQYKNAPTRYKIFTGHTDRVLACAIAPDGLRAVSASADRTLRYWNLETGSTLVVLTGHTAEVTGCAFTNDGRRIISRSKDGRLGLWDGGSGSLIAFTQGHTDWVNAFAISEDEGVVYSCSEDQTVRAWDLETGEPRGVVYGVSPFRSLAAVAGGVYAGDEAGNLWVLEYGEGLRPVPPTPS